MESPAFAEPLLLLAVDGEFRAIGATCTHQQCSVRPGRTSLRCPCHGSTYSLTGDVLRGPAQKPLNRYETSADATVIRIAPRPVSS